MKREKILEALKGRLIVSCQALDHEPLHSSFIMGRMAYAAYLGGAGGIRAGSVKHAHAVPVNHTRSCFIACQHLKQMKDEQEGLFLVFKGRRPHRHQQIRV